MPPDPSSRCAVARSSRTAEMTRILGVNKGLAIVTPLSADGPSVDFEFRLNCGATRDEAIEALQALEWYVRHVGPLIPSIPKVSGGRP
jgi:hypothetical protein